MILKVKLELYVAQTAGYLVFVPIRLPATHHFSFRPDFRNHLILSRLVFNLDKRAGLEILLALHFKARGRHIQHDANHPARVSLVSVEHGTLRFDPGKSTFVIIVNHKILSAQLDFRSIVNCILVQKCKKYDYIL